MKPKVIRPLYQRIGEGTHRDGLASLIGREGYGDAVDLFIVAAIGSARRRVEIDRRLSPAAVAGDREGDVGPFAGRSRLGRVHDCIIIVQFRLVLDEGCAIRRVEGVGGVQVQVKLEVLIGLEPPIFGGLDGHGCDGLVGRVRQELQRDRHVILIACRSRCRRDEYVRSEAAAAARNREGDRAALGHTVGRAAGGRGHRVAVERQGPILDKAACGRRLGCRRGIFIEIDMKGLDSFSDAVHQRGHADGLGCLVGREDQGLLVEALEVAAVGRAC